MTKADALIDTFAASGGRFFGRHAPVQGWPKPIGTSCGRPSYRDLVEGKVTSLSLDGPPDMEFCITVPWAASEKDLVYVKPQPAILDRFLELGAADDTAIYRFAAKFGPLLAFSQTEARVEEHQLLVREYAEVWRYLSRSLKALMRIAARLYAPSTPDPQDWDIIGACPLPVYSAVSKIKSGDWVDPQPFLSEAEWSGMSHLIGRGHSRNQQTWTLLLNLLLRMGRARPWVVWKKGSRPGLVFSRPSLLSYLALQVCLRTLRQDAFVSCSHCSEEYAPLRAPKTGQRNYCPECRRQGVPLRDAQRDRRARSRRARGGARRAG